MEETSICDGELLYKVTDMDIKMFPRWEDASCGIWERFNVVQYIDNQLVSLLTLKFGFYGVMNM
jgi:hypothetical protein